MKVKTIKDYYELIYEMFPDVPKEDIKKILNYGWKTFYMYNSAGADVSIKDKNFWMYIGYLKKDSVEYCKYYIKKLVTKIRILYKRYKIDWDGYYYFALSDSSYENYISLKKKRGRKKKWFNFGKVFLYKILDECKLENSNHKYIFRVPYISDIGFKTYDSEFISDKAELIIERNPMKFSDILVNNNEYEFI